MRPSGIAAAVLFPISLTAHATLDSTAPSDVFRICSPPGLCGLDTLIQTLDKQLPGASAAKMARDSVPAQCSEIGIMLALRLAMIQSEPVMTRRTISSPKARARILFVLSGPLPRCRKKTR